MPIRNPDANMMKLGIGILRSFGIAILFFAAFFYSFAADEGASSAVKDLIDKASKASAAGKYDEAISYADQAIQIDSNHAEAYNLRGVALYGKNQSKKAIEDFDRAIKLKPDFTVAYTNRGNANVGLGLYDSDIDDQTMALKLSPNYARAYAGRGVAYRWKEEYDRAIADFSRALELEPEDFSSYRNRGNSYYARNEYALAIKDFDRAIQMRPERSDLYWLRARPHLKTGNLDAALADANQSLEKNPKEARAFFFRAEIYLGKGNFDRAIKDYSESLELELSERHLDAAYFGRAKAFEAKGLVNDALNDFRKAAELKPDNKEYARELKELEENPNDSTGRNAETVKIRPPEPTPSIAGNRTAPQPRDIPETSPDGGRPTLDELMAALDQSLGSGNVDKSTSLIHPVTRSKYRQLFAAHPTDLARIAAVLKSRVALKIGAESAEYRISEDGQKYVVEFRKRGGAWFLFEF